MKFTVKVFGAFVSVITAAVIIIAGVFTVPRFFGVNPYVVLSGSMEPNIHVGAVAFVNTKDTDISEGDIITFRIGEEGETLVTHRAVKINDDGSITTKGDANDTEDPSPVLREQVLGTYMAQIPYAGFVLAKLDQKGLVLAAIWVAILNAMSMVLGWAAKDGGETKEAEDKAEIGNKTESSENK